MYRRTEGVDLLRRLEGLGGRLRAIVDDHDEQGEAESAETISANRLAAAGAETKRMHFGRQQHNKVLIVRRNGDPIRVLTGSIDELLPQGPLHPGEQRPRLR